MILRNSLYLFVCAVLQLHSNGVAADRGSSLGCYRQNLYLHRIQGLSGSVDACIESCEQDFFSYAVLDGNSCLCSNTINEQELHTDECDRPCSAQASQICGGSYAQSYYDTDIKVAGPPRNVRVVSRTDTSINLHWQHFDPHVLRPTDTSLSRYVIRAKIVKSYSSMAKLPLPQWSVEKGTDSFVELLGLNPGTTFNITVQSVSDEHGEGGTSSIIADTEIGIPDPEPPQPKVIKREGQTMTIEIPPLINNNGPITAVQVVVVFVDSELSQTFDKNLLKNFNQAHEDGTSYYIAAELLNENRTRQFIIGDGKNYNGYTNAPLNTDRHVHAALGIISTMDSVTKSRYAVETSHEQHGDGPKLSAAEHADDEEGSLTAVLTVACFFFGILLVLSIAVYLFLRFRLDSRLRRLPSDHHELTLQGPIVEVENNGGYQPDEFTKRSFEQKLDDLIEQVEPNKKFARNALTLDVNNIIANGQYGDVIRGKLNGEPCQVHVISEDMEPLDQSQFLKDLSMVQKLAVHQNVISFYGICQTADWLYLLFEDTPTTLKRSLIESRTPPNVNPHRFSSLSEQRVLVILHEIAVAMEYLTSEQFVHKTLCSYNIRLTSDETVKISWFGAKSFDNNGKLIDLTRWSAPEVLRFQHHSERSDVWSFACLMWECCSLGGTLYADISAGDLLSRIKAGTRPERIPFVFDDMNQLLLNCWQTEPSERPTFAEISHTLRQLMTSPHHVMSFDRRDGILLPYYLPLLEVQSAP